MGSFQDGMVDVASLNVKDNQGKVRIAGKPDIGALYDERGQWFVENVVASPDP